LDPDRAEQKLNIGAKSIVPVHLYGYPANMQAIVEAAKNHGVSIVEDCCQAHGALYKGNRVGSLGDVGCFSFYPSKNMTVCGDGGMAVTNNEETANKIAKLRDCGRKSHYEHDMMGVTARLNTVNAAIGRVQLKMLEGWNQKRREVAKQYYNLLSDVNQISLPPNGSSQTVPVYHLYVIRTSQRDQLKSYLESRGIQCGIHYPLPIHLQPIYKRLFGYREGDFPASELAAKQVMSLPMYPHLQKEAIEKISEEIHNFFNG
jgi:dTDP-4-amino-4,6-dideoxygalactose transaminase